MASHQQTLLGFGGGSSASVPAVMGHSLLYSGNGSAGHAITGAEIAPDLVITRRRPGQTGEFWEWYDTVRGTGLCLHGGTNSAESSDANSLTAFNSDGFTLGTSTRSNVNAANYLALVLKKIASGLDIVTYTGTGANRTVSHGLGVTPELMIVKNRSTGSRSWAVYSSTLGNTKGMNLDSASGSATQTSYWNSTSPTSSVFTVGVSTLTNANGDNYVAYLFASLNPGIKIGSYTGDGNTNGATITIGFKPRIVIIKRTDTTGSWVIFEDLVDASSPHNTFNKMEVGGASSETACTNSAGGLDFLSTGFQSIDSDPANINVNGATYIYIAIG